MSRPLVYWMAAALLAVGLVVLHLFSGAWVTRVFPELNRSITDPTQTWPRRPLPLCGVKPTVLRPQGHDPWRDD
jgi:hypothetical protein